MIDKLETNASAIRVGEMQPDQEKLVDDETPIGIRRLRILMAMFDISLGDLSNASGRAISKSQIQRFTSGQRTNPNAKERHALSVGLINSLKSRCDSSYLFSE